MPHIDSQPIEEGSQPIEEGSQPIEEGSQPIEEGSQPIEEGSQPIEEGSQLIEETVGERIRRRRKALGLTQDQVASKLGAVLKVSRNAIAQWESGDTRPAQKRITAIAAVLEVSPAWIEYGKGPIPPERTPQAPTFDEDMMRAIMVAVLKASDEMPNIRRDLIARAAVEVAKKRAFEKGTSPNIKELTSAITDLAHFGDSLVSNGSNG